MSSFESQIRGMKHSDLVYVVQIHSHAFPNFFMTLLGISFLRSYYLTVLEYKKSISLVSVDRDGNITGFAVGFFDSSSFYKFFKMKFYRFFFSTFMAFIRRPYLLKRIFGGFLRVNKSERKGHTGKIIEISSIGVITKGSGVGKSLLGAFIDVSFKQGAEAVVLTTDMYNNDGVIAFYKGRGFVQSDIDVRGDRPMIQFTLINPKNNST